MPSAWSWTSRSSPPRPSTPASGASARPATSAPTPVPTGSILNDNEPTWDIPQIYGKADNTHVPGKKQFWTDGVSCWSLKATFGGCGQCMGICTFNTGSAAIHSYVKATLATTPAFNDFLWRADVWWGYGAHEDKENWWNLTSRPWLRYHCRRHHYNLLTVISDLLTTRVGDFPPPLF